MKFVEEKDANGFMAGEPGLGLACCEWLHQRDVAVVASDNWAIEALPGEIDTHSLPVHMVLIRDMGMTLGEYSTSTNSAAHCEADGVLLESPHRPTDQVHRCGGLPHATRWRSS